MSLKQWFVDTLNVDVVPPTWMKWVIIIAASVIGGLAFAMSGRWSVAIPIDLFAMFCLWLISRLAEMIGEGIVRVVLFILP